MDYSIYDLGEFKDKGKQETTTAETSGINLSLLGLIPIADVGYFYGRAGIMFWQADYERFDPEVTESDEDGIDFTYGAGFAWQFSEHYDVRFEYERLHELGNDFVAGGSAVDVFNIAGTVYF